MSVSAKAPLLPCNPSYMPIHFHNYTLSSWKVSGMSTTKNFAGVLIWPPLLEYLGPSSTVVLPVSRLSSMVSCWMLLLCNLCLFLIFLVCPKNTINWIDLNWQVNWKDSSISVARGALKGISIQEVKIHLSNVPVLQSPDLTNHFICRLMPV